MAVKLKKLAKANKSDVQIYEQTTTVSSRELFTIEQVEADIANHEAILVKLKKRKADILALDA